MNACPSTRFGGRPGQSFAPNSNAKPCLALDTNSSPSKCDATLLVIVNKETPEEHFLIFPAPQTAAVDVCAHLDGHLELDAAVAEEGEEQPRVVFGEGAVVVKLPAAYAAVL